MSHSTRVIAAVAMLLPIALLSRAETFGPVSAATHSVLSEVNEDSVDAYIRASMRTAHIPGLALGVVQGDHVAYLKGYGVAGPDGRSVTAQTLFILGSTSKSFTALAVMQLVEAGKIDLDAPVTKYLPWFRTLNAAGSAQISVRQRPWRRLSNRRRVSRQPHASGTRRVGGRWGTSASSAMRGIGYAHSRP